MCGKNSSFRMNDGAGNSGGYGKGRGGLRAHAGGRCRSCTCADRKTEVDAVSSPSPPSSGRSTRAIQVARTLTEDAGGFRR